MGAGARRIHQWSIENHVRMAEAIAQEGIDCAYQKRGSLQLAGSAQEEQELVESAELLVEDGFEATLTAELPSSLRMRASRWCPPPADGELHPHASYAGSAKPPHSSARDSSRTAV